ALQRRIGDNYNAADHGPAACLRLFCESSAHSQGARMQIEIAAILRYLPGAIVLFAASTLVAQTHTQAPDRSTLSDQLKWDLTAPYRTDQAWREEKENLVPELRKLREFQ